MALPPGQIPTTGAPGHEQWLSGPTTTQGSFAAAATGLNAPG